VVANGNRYEIEVNRDANVVLVICMVLAINTALNDNKEATVSYDFGNIGPEDRPFDKSWQTS
jgi:hypothetical protein